MNILLLGSGGREHAFAWKLAQSKKLRKLYIAPGNGGTINCGTNVTLDIMNFNEVGQFVMQNDISMVVVGPEQPLVAGIVDYFEADEKLKSVQIVGPNKAAAQLEGSKAFANDFMKKYDIPTADYKTFTGLELEAGLNYIETQTPPIVLKADGLAAGKGVVITPTIEEGKKELKDMLTGKFGNAGARVVIEEFLDGIECSVFVLTDGKDYKILPVAKDYKRIGEGDTGLNTGGMGAISPVPFADEVFMKKVTAQIIEPTLKGLKLEGITYNGFIFIGLIKVNNEPYVIEYNCRMGDPETEVVLPRIESDLVELFEALDNGGLNNCELKISEQHAATIMLVSGGYPEAYEKGKIIELSEIRDNTLVFHAGTKLEDGKLKTNGGRVLALTTLSNDWKVSIEHSLKIAKQVQFEGKIYRKDIGFDL